MTMNRRDAMAHLGALGGVGILPTLGWTASAAVSASSAWSPADLGERIWLDWRAEDVAVGLVSEWKDRAGGILAQQPVVGLQPEKLSTGEVLFGTYGQRLNIPFQGSAHLAHRSVVILFRADSGSASFSDGCLLSFNGVDGGQASRQPAVTYTRKGRSISLQTEWRDASGLNEISHDLPNDFSRWHCLVSRRVAGRHYASLDGCTEQLVGDNICLMVNRSKSSGLIGDIRPASMRWAVDTILVLQDELSKGDAERLMGWAMWRRNAQAQLPVDHPYRLQAPLKTIVAGAAYQETSAAEWALMKPWWEEANMAQCLESHHLEPLDLRGYKRVFEDHFTSFSLSDEASGRGPWWTPVHGAATGKAITARLSDTPATFIQSGSELTIRMQHTARGWTSGVFTSVNLNGHGNTWKYGYFEFRARASVGNGYAAWPAFWVKSVNEFFRLTESRLEIDLYEGYNSDRKGHHQAYHNWPAARQVKGRLSTHRFLGNYTGLSGLNWGGKNVDLFDDNYHSYGLMVDENWVKFYFDGRELSRFPTPIEAKQPVFLLVDLALLPHQMTQASGVYELTLDYVRVYQRS